MNTEQQNSVISLEVDKALDLFIDIALLVANQILESDETIQTNEKSDIIRQSE